MLPASVTTAARNRGTVLLPYAPAYVDLWDGASPGASRSAAAGWLLVNFVAVARFAARCRCRGSAISTHGDGDDAGDMTGSLSASPIPTEAVDVLSKLAPLVPLSLWLQPREQDH